MTKNSVRAMMFLVFSVVVLSGTSISSQTRKPTVKINDGTLQGLRVADVEVFKGIPYAAPPIGTLRWRAPQPINKPWKGVRQATEFGHDCVQMPIPGDVAPTRSTKGEDCLVVKVWRPATVRPGDKLPVMVWIHGGGFLNGGSSDAIADGSAFAHEGLVVVSLNYRLGRMGFFAHPSLTAAKEGPLANYGLMDQLAALRWVRRNIAAFGGDPDQVTIVGESAGGISVIHLLTWPEARGLFQRAAVLSGGGRTLMPEVRSLSTTSGQLSSAEETGVEFAKTVGITTNGIEALKALRALPAARVNGDMSMMALITKPKTYTGGPVLDGQIVTALPEEIFRRGRATKVPLLIGTTSQDLPALFPPDRANPLSYFGADAERAKAVYDPSGNLPLPALLATVSVDMTMHEPARFVAKQMTARGNSVWLYRFGYIAESLRPKATGAEHASELPYMFDTLDTRYGKEATEKDRATAHAFHLYFANFAKTGDPNGSSLPNWPKFDPARTDLMQFTPGEGPVVRADPWTDRLDLVERVADSEASSQSTSSDLGGTSWQLIKFQGSDDKTLTPDEKNKYTIAFGTDGQLTARIDCNRGVGTWKSSGTNQVEFGPLALTRAMCPPGSLHDQIAKNWKFIRGYTLKDGHLFLSLMSDGGIYEFEPISQSPAETKASIFGTRWRLTEVNGTAVSTTRVYIEFDDKAKRFSGDGGCNRIAGAFQVNGMQIKFSKAISTKRACLDNNVQQIETNFIKGLDEASRFEPEGDTLRMYAGDRSVLTFKRDKQ